MTLKFKENILGMMTFGEVEKYAQDIIKLVHPRFDADVHTILIVRNGVHKRKVFDYMSSLGGSYKITKVANGRFKLKLTLYCDSPY